MYVLIRSLTLWKWRKMFDLWYMTVNEHLLRLWCQNKRFTERLAFVWAPRCQNGSISLHHLKRSFSRTKLMGPGSENNLVILVHCHSSYLVKLIRMFGLNKIQSNFIRIFHNEEIGSILFWLIQQLCCWKLNTQSVNTGVILHVCL